MANPQKENGYTPIANESLEQLVKLPLNGTQWRIITVVLRYTYGFNRKKCEISESFLAKATGISKRFIASEIKKLIDGNILNVVKESTYTSPKIISFNKDYDKWKVGTMPQQLNNASTGEQEYASTVEVSFHSTGERSFHQDKQIFKTNEDTIVSSPAPQNAAPAVMSLPLNDSTLLSVLKNRQYGSRTKIGLLFDESSRRFSGRTVDAINHRYPWDMGFSEIGGDEPMPFKGTK